MLRFVSFTGLAVLLLSLGLTDAQALTYGERLCSYQHNDPTFAHTFYCITVHRRQSWNSLFPDPAQRDIVQRLNRMNTPLYSGLQLAIPNDLKTMDTMSFSPMPQDIGIAGHKVIVVDPKQLAWGAYNDQGQLVRWGPASAGKSFCPDVGRECKTPSGQFEIYTKEGSDCISTKFPVGEGGAPMPYCMFFHSGFALHGSYEVPGFNASHGCVRMFKDDAQWLNQNFIDVPDANGNPGTVVIVKPYS